jgi:hypothetical protein
MAETQWKNGSTSYLDPEVTPSEKQAVYGRFPQFHKFTGKMDVGFYSSIGYSELASYLHSKH